MEDTRTGYIEGGETHGDSIRLFFKTNAKVPLKSKTILVPKPYVIDGGFNYFIKSNWEEIIKGNEMTFNIAIPSELDYYKFRITKEKETVYDKKNAVILKLELDNVVLRYLAGPITIIYDVESKRLLSYEGLSNIRNSSGKNYEVRISYPTEGP